MQADVVLIASLDKQLLFDTSHPQRHGVAFPFPKLIARAESGESANGLVLLDHDLDAIAVTPILAPAPIAWLCPTFRVDDDFAREIQSFTDLEITFFSAKRLFASTFDGAKRETLLSILDDGVPIPNRVVSLPIAGENFLSYAVPLAAENGNVAALLQRSLDKELAPYLRIERTYLILALLGLAVSVALGFWIARGVSRPVLDLAEGAQKIAEGDYSHRVNVRQHDEIGALAKTFNRMSAGLEERDRVRSLLGKVISPTVAAELLRHGVALGGEEREVTVLFSDLRDFTAIGEALPPQETVSVLNHYFTRMAAIVDEHHGVVDKYVGDGLMALFGAPLANPDAADAALSCALDMTAALDELNGRWQDRGLPVLGLGIGINTDVVVAGNMGSETRLNYTVVGDGVNLASRLEALTKTAEYHTRIIVSCSTLAKAKRCYRTRRLGEVAVKGKRNSTEIFALLGRKE